MRIALIICVIMALLIVSFNILSKNKPTAADVLNYDEMIFLDAEELGEGSIGTAYKEDILPVLRKHVETPAEIVEEINPEAELYKVISQGKAYVIYSPGMVLNEGQNWGNATFALFDIVNCQLQNSPYRFYAINGGNDLSGMFLTQEIYKKAIKSIKRKADRPYLPTPDHPWYGQPHD